VGTVHAMGGLGAGVGVGASGTPSSFRYSGVGGGGGGAQNIGHIDMDNLTFEQLQLFQHGKGLGFPGSTNTLNRDFGGKPRPAMVSQGCANCTARKDSFVIKCALFVRI
jgi:hypothetical protein